MRASTRPSKATALNMSSQTELPPQPHSATRYRLLSLAPSETAFRHGLRGKHPAPKNFALRAAVKESNGLVGAHYRCEKPLRGSNLRTSSFGPECGNACLRRIFVVAGPSSDGLLTEPEADARNGGRKWRAARGEGHQPRLLHPLQMAKFAISRQMFADIPSLIARLRAPVSLAGAARW